VTPPSASLRPAGALPLSVQAGYSSAEVGINAVETSLRLYLLIFYTDSVGLRPGLAGLALALGLLWDAVTDPVMGAISDRTVERFGGRRFFVLIGGVLLAVGVVAVFWPPPLTSQAACFGWLLVSFCFLNLGLTVIAVPHMAMAGEMTADPHERSVLFGWRFAAANVGAVLAAALPGLFLAESSDRTVSAMGPVSAAIGVLVVATAGTTWWVTRRVRFRTAPPARMGFFAGLETAFANPAFRPLLAAYVVATIGIGLNAAVALYYYGYRLQLDDGQIQVMLVVFIAVFTLSIVAWVRLSASLGKRRPMVIGSITLGLCTAVMYPLLPPGVFVYPLVLGAVGLGCLVGCIVLIDSMLTDVIDHDRIHTGHARSGVFFGVWRFASKLARAAAIAATGALLDAVGFVPNQPQTAAVGDALALLFGPGVGACFCGAGWILWRYRFDDAKQRQVQRILRRRERARPD